MPQATRAAEGSRLFNAGLRPSSWLRRIGAALGLFRASSLAAWLSGAAQREARELTRPMEQRIAVYSGVRAIAQTMAGLPLVLHREGDRKALIDGGPARELLNRPRAGWTARDLVEQWAGHLIEGGEAHLLLDNLLLDGRPLTMFGRTRIGGLDVVGRRQMQERRGDEGQLLDWTYTPLGGSRQRTIAAEGDLYTRLFNPYDAIRGLGPLQAAALELKQDYQASLYNVNALTNGSAAGGLYVLPGNPSEEERAEYLRMLRERHSGPENARKPGLLWGGADYKDTAWKNTDLELLESRRFSRSEILNVLGVPPVIVAIYESAHYDVADASIEIFMLHTIGPLVAAFEALLNAALLPAIEPGVAAYLDVMAHPVMQRVRARKLETLAKAISCGIPFNEARGVAGLPEIAEQPQWGDVSLLPPTLAPASEVVAPATPPAENAPTAGIQGSRIEDAGTGGTPAAPTSIPQSPDPSIPAFQAGATKQFEERLIQGEAPRVRAMYRVYFARRGEAAIKALRAAMKSRADRSETGPTQSLNPSIAQSPLRAMGEDEARKLAEQALGSSEPWIAELRRMLARYFRLAQQNAIEAEFERLGVEADKREELLRQALDGFSARAALAAKRLKIGGIELETRNRIRAQLVEGLKANETVAELAERVQKVTGGALGRARVIAWNEAGQAVSSGRFAAMSAAGSRKKIWLTGANPRPTHIAAGVDYAAGSGIPLEAKFKVGDDELDYPRDPRGSAEEIVNCNCVVVSE